MPMRPSPHSITLPCRIPQPHAPTAPSLSVATTGRDGTLLGHAESCARRSEQRADDEPCHGPPPPVGRSLPPQERPIPCHTPSLSSSLKPRSVTSHRSLPPDPAAPRTNEGLPPPQLDRG
ncbi:hypothetical protein E2562_014123 [Oryza meyeriana var. granulata]|uniref:Uncharacterized protein n=1 Tax=Oryza meyeriana var. granulata TaxID=110450 RepID=A0A6G1F8F5_9ORYZ|nr:hypothetical protein E2562_014123 [Oryza meyeriana var. granulata]